MTEILYRTEVDCSTGVEQQIPLTEQEVLEHQALVSAFQEQEALRIAAEEAKLAAKNSAQSKLAQLGLTPEEIAALSN